MFPLKLKKTFVFYLFLLFINSLQSCSIESSSLSKTTKSQKPNEISKNTNYVDLSTVTIENNLDKVKYTSDITNAISLFPKFKNYLLNEEIDNLKITLQNYIFATKRYDKKSTAEAYRTYVLQYKKIQGLKKNLNKDNRDLLDLYLVRIKCNINILQSIDSY